MQSLMGRLAKYLVGKYLPEMHLKKKAKGYKRAPRKKKTLVAVETAEIHGSAAVSQ